MLDLASRLVPFITLGALLAQGPVSPADRTHAEGSSFTHFPLGRFDCRMQQLHGDLPAGAVLSGHAYRRDAIGIRARVEGLAADMEVILSVAPHAPNRASATFANNVGSNPVVVLPRTQVAFPATDRPAMDPAASFDLMVVYQVPYVVPAAGGTICVDTQIFGNVTPAGANRNASIYLDAHEFRSDGSNEQPGMRFGAGCAAPGNAAGAFGTFTLWHRGTSMSLDLASRGGVADTGGNTRVFVLLGTAQATTPWPLRPQCTLLTSSDVWFPMPGNNDGSGDFDGSYVGMPVLPAGHRLWLQSGSIDLVTGAFVLGDGSTLNLPPVAATTAPSARIVDANSHLGVSGAVSFAVPVVRFL